MKNDFNEAAPQLRLRFQSYVVAFRKGVRVIALIGLTFSLTSVGSTSSSSTSTQTADSTALERVAALSRKFAITSFPSLPQGVAAVSLAPGASQPTLASETGTDASSSASASSTDPAVVVQSRAEMQTPGGYIATAPLNGLTPGSYLIVHSDGTVSANSPDSNVLWNRASFEFTQWTGRYPTSKNGTSTPWTPIVVLGLDPIEPYTVAGEHPFALGDLNGDGVDEIAVAHYFQAVAAIDGYNNGNPSIGGTFVSVLDANNGNLIWSHMYPGFVANLAIEDSMLIVANETGNVQSMLGQNGSVSNLDAWRFSTSGGTLQAAHAWSVSTGAQWAPWLALEKVPNGKIAAAWTNSPEGSANATNGTELVVSLATGAVDWSVATTGYPRFLRFDSSRNQIVAVEEADPTLTYSYSLVARNLIDGSLANSVAEDSATALNFQISDLDGDGNNDWVVTDLGYLPCAPVGCLGVQDSGRVLAINGSTGAEEWSQVRTGNPVNPNDPLNGTPSPQPYGLLIAPTASGADVLVGSFIGPQIELERLNGGLNLNGPGGTVLWSQTSANAFLPLFISLYDQGGNQFVRAASSRPKLYGYSVTFNNAGATVFTNGRTPFQVVRSFDISTGNQVSVVPLLGRIHSAVGTKVNGDNTTDLIVGGESGAVFALDGTRIDNHPIYLWRRTVAGPVHQIAAADLDGDGRDEIVVAASQAIDVLDSATGNLRYEIPYATDYIWSFVLADLNGDGKVDIVVPGASSLTAYSGPDGATLWSYAPSGTQAVGTLFGNVAITPDNIVTAQFAFGTQNPVGRTGSGFSRALVGINGATGTVLWSDSNAGSSPLDSTFSSFPQFWSGTVAGQLDGILGSVVGFSWVGYDSSKDAGGVCQSCFTPEMEIRDALTGTIITSLPPPWIYNGSNGTLLIPEKGLLSYAGNASWLLTTTDSGQALGHDIPITMAEGNFGVLGKRVVEGAYLNSLLVFPPNGIDISGWTSSVPHSAYFNDAISVTNLQLQDLDGDGIDEIMRTPNDIDGQVALVQAIQGFGYEQTVYSDGLDILEVAPVAPPLVSVVSRKLHGGSATFDLPLNSGTPATIEPRAGGISSGDHTLVFSFLNVVSTVSSVTATATTSSGTVPVTVLNTSGIGADTHEYIVNLSGVPNASHLKVTLSSVTDSAGDIGNVSAHMDVLLGDVNSSGRTDSGDVTAVRSHTVSVPDQQTFQFDVNTSGRIDSGDVTVTRNASVTVLP